MLTRQLYWSLDYAYVTRKQFFGVISRTQAVRYRNQDSSKPSIILIPGIYESWQFMKPIAKLLYRHGYDVHVIEKLGYNRHDIEAMADVVSQHIDASPAHEFILIAHSKGGLIGKYVLATHNHHKRVKGLIALHTPFSGSLYAYLFLLHKPLRMFVPNSSILRRLAKNQDVNSHIVSIYGKFDPHIPGGSKLEGAKNIQLDTHGHFRIMDDSTIHQTILGELKNMTET